MERNTNTLMTVVSSLIGMLLSLNVNATNVQLDESIGQCDDPDLSDLRSYPLLASVEVNRLGGARFQGYGIEYASENLNTATGISHINSNENVVGGYKEVIPATSSSPREAFSIGPVIEMAAFEVSDVQPAPLSIPTAFMLFGSAIIGMIVVARRTPEENEE